MNLELDEDLRSLAEYMQCHIAAEKLVAVAQGLAALAPLLWGHHDRRSITPLALRNEPISACDPHTRSASSELSPGFSGHVGDRFVEEEAAPR
jgi:hypothetical protein